MPRRKANPITATDQNQRKDLNFFADDVVLLVSPYHFHLDVVEKASLTHPHVSHSLNVYLT